MAYAGPLWSTSASPRRSSSSRATAARSRLARLRRAADDRDRHAVRRVPPPRYAWADPDYDGRACQPRRLPGRPPAAPCARTARPRPTRPTTCGRSAWSRPPMNRPRAIAASRWSPRHEAPSILDLARYAVPIPCRHGRRCAAVSDAIDGAMPRSVDDGGRNLLHGSTTYLEHEKTGHDGPVREIRSEILDFLTAADILTPGGDPTAPGLFSVPAPAACPFTGAGRRCFCVGLAPIMPRRAGRWSRRRSEVVDPQAVGHAQEQVRHRLAAVLDVAARRQRPAAAAGQEDGQVVVRVAVAVGVAAAVDDHRVVEQRVAVDVLRLARASRGTGRTAACSRGRSRRPSRASSLFWWCDR